MKVCFYIDVKVRDIPIVKFLSKKLSEVCYLSMFKTMNKCDLTFKLQMKEKPDFIITPSYNYKRIPEVAIRAILSDSILIEFTSEQFYSNNFIPEKILEWKDDNCLGQDFYFVWGEYYARKLCNIGKVPSDRIFIIGSPKVELASLYKNNSFKKITNNNILFISDYVIADFNKDDIEKFYKTYKVKISLEEVEIIKKERLNAIKVANILAENGFNIIFRLHPGENKEIYYKLLNKKINIVEAEYPLFEDIVKSDLVIGYTTTSVFEVLAMGKKFISLHEYSYPQIVWRDFLSDIKSVNKVQLLTEINNFISNQLEELYDMKKIKYYIDNIDYAYSTQDSFKDALLYIRRELQYKKKCKKIDVLRLLKFYYINIMALFLKCVSNNNLIFKILKRYFPNRVKALRGNIHAFSLKDMDKFDIPDSILRKNDIKYVYRKFDNIGFKYIKMDKKL